MYKIIILTIIVFFFSNCDITMQSAKADRLTPSFQLNEHVQVTVYAKDGIEYRVFHSPYTSNGGVCVVNHTKELLEVELLKKTLNKK
jgi:hypothetical protein